MVDAIRLQQVFNFESAASRHHAHMHSLPYGPRDIKRAMRGFLMNRVNLCVPKNTAVE